MSQRRTKKHYYVTTPIYYVNANPHIGHAYTNVLCDAFVRYRRFLGERVFFLTGTDEHGTKIERIAREKKLSPKEFVDEMVPRFKEMWRLLGIQYDQFIRTTDDEHKTAVGNILSMLEAKGEIYKAKYTGWYCTPCESFWTELQLKEGKCPDCSREVQELSEENYFFRLSKYQDWLIQYIREHPDFILPEIRRNEVLAFLREPLEDLCITRPKSRLSWGIPYPNSPEHVVYVWFDALVNYISAAGFTVDDKKFRRFWPADVHLLAKDILRQHAVYWPIMLKACELEMPRTVLVHGWWKIAGSKVSKSLGNIVDPGEVVKIYGVDAFRYFLLREASVGADSAYSEDLLAIRYTTDLANDLGNLWFRVASMLERYFNGEVPCAAPSFLEEALIGRTWALWDEVRVAMDAFDPRSALEKIWAVVTLANQYVEEKKPWVLAKDPGQKESLAFTLRALTECVAHLAVILVPFLPDTSKKMLKHLKLRTVVAMKTAADFRRPFVLEGTVVSKGEALFPRIEEPEK